MHAHRSPQARHLSRLVGNDDNTWEGQTDIHPDLIAEFERHQVTLDAANPIYSTLGEDAPSNAHEPPSPPKEAPPAKKKKTSNHSSTTTTTTTVKEPKKKLFGVEKGWRVRAVIGAAKQKDSSVLYAVDYAQGSPLLREYVPSDIAHAYIPRELIEFFQKKIVWNSSNESKKT